MCMCGVTFLPLPMPVTLAMHVCCYLNNAASNKSKHYYSPSSGWRLRRSSSFAIIAVDFTAAAFSIGNDAYSYFLSLRSLLPSPRKWLSAARVGSGCEEAYPTGGETRNSLFSSIFSVSRFFFFQILFLSHPSPQIMLHLGV